VATGLLGGLLMTSLGMADVRAGDPSPKEPAAASDDCVSRPSEKSIVIDNAKAPTHDPGVALATDQSGEVQLEPIANSSEYEPQPADDPSAQSLTPTPADEPVQATVGDLPATTVTAQQPTADDVCVDDDAPDESPAVRADQLQAAAFSGVTPGVSTRADVLSQWGDPLESEVGGRTLTYEMKSFPRVAVAFSADRVESIRIGLFEPVKPQVLVTRLGLADFRPATTKDDAGQTLTTTFPERGVTLILRPAVGAAMATDASKNGKGQPAGGVYEIVVRPVAAAPFLRRAEGASEYEYGHRIADLQLALELDPSSAPVHALLAELKLKAGQALAAEQLAAKAVELEPASDAYRLQWAACLKALARYDQAVEETRRVLEGATASPIVRAQALELMGLLAALGSREIQERAIPLHNKAIELADSLAAGDDPVVRRAAGEVLLSAHLAVAERIAVGQWQQKDVFVGQWISRASALAEQMIADGEGDVSLRLQVAVSALVAGGRLTPPIDPQLWIGEAEQAAAELEPAVSDVIAHRLLDWQLGLAYSCAAEIEHRRGDSALAIKYGELADSRLSPLAEVRADLPDTQFVLGRTYFQIGAVHAVHRQDHATACQWYDRAAELLMQPAPVTALANPGQHGDALVSMGVSYWEVGQRQRAYDLTQAGVELVEQGVAEGLLAADSLAVPKGNLSAMARVLGKTELAAPAGQMAEARTAPARRTSANRQQSRVADRSAANADGARRR
jgi:tetratricopeptide (TPR) repeat protein